MAKKNRCKLENGKFYDSYGGESHPALIFEKTNKNTYKSIKFGTTKNKHMTKIKPIQKGYEKSYVLNRPFEGTRKDYGDRELLGLSIHKKDVDLIEEIKKRPSHKSKRAKYK